MNNMNKYEPCIEEREEVLTFFAPIQVVKRER
jgi:hypothetical protein